MTEPTTDTTPETQAVTEAAGAPVDAPNAPLATDTAPTPLRLRKAALAALMRPIPAHELEAP